MSKYAAGYSDGKSRAIAEIHDRLAYRHITDCICEPCQLIRSILNVPLRRLWGAPGQTDKDDCYGV